MLKKIFGVSIGFLSLLLLSNGVFAKNYVYRFEAGSNWNQVFNGGPPTFQPGAVPSNCKVQTTNGDAPVILTCKSPLQYPDTVQIFIGSTQAGNEYMLSCDASGPNSQPALLPSACICSPVPPTVGPCPKY